MEKPKECNCKYPLRKTTREISYCDVCGGEAIYYQMGQPTESKEYIECRKHGTTWKDYNRVCPMCLDEWQKSNQKEQTFKNFNLGMFRQWFGELPEEETFTAVQIWDMLNQACPLFPEEVIDDWNKQADDLMSGYAKQMAENHAMLIDKNFWLVVKQKPKYMPSFLYKSVIKNLIEFQKHQ